MHKDGLDPRDPKGSSATKWRSGHPFLDTRVGPATEVVEEARRQNIEIVQDGDSRALTAGSAGLLSHAS